MIRRSVLAVLAACLLSNAAQAADARVMFRATPHSDSDSFDPAAEFSFSPVSSALLRQVVQSSPSTFVGPRGASPLSVSGGEYRICGASDCSDLGVGGWATGTGSVRSGQFVQVRLVASGMSSTTTKVSATIGSATREFAVTTRPDAPTMGAFTETADADALVPVVSNQVRVSGWADAPISAGSGTEIEVCRSGGACQAFASTATVSDGDQIRVRTTTPAAGTSKSIQVVVDGRSMSAWKVSSKAVQLYPNIEAKCNSWVGTAKASDCQDAHINVNSVGWAWIDFAYGSFLGNVWCKVISGNAASKASYSQIVYGPTTYRNKYFVGRGSDSYFAGRIEGNDVSNFYFGGGSTQTSYISCTLWK